MDPHLLAAGRGFLQGKLGRLELTREVARFDWDDVSPTATAVRPFLGMLELVLTEVAEGLRDESELAPRVHDLLAAVNAAPVT